MDFNGRIGTTESDDLEVGCMVDRVWEIAK